MPREPKLVIDMPSQKSILCTKDQYLSDASLNALQKGKELLAQNKLQEAIEYLNSSHGENPYHIDTLINMGAIAHASRDDFSAIKVFQRVCEIAPDFVDGYNLLARAYMTISENDEALPILEKAYELDKKNTKTLISLSELHLIGGNKQKAKIYARKAIDIELSYYTASFYGFYFLEPDDDNAQSFVEYLKRQIDTPITSSYKLKLYRALAKYHEKTGDYNTAFEYMENLNSLKKSIIKFDEDAYITLAAKTQNFFDSSYIKANKSDNFNDDRSVFVFGMPRSGTTLLEQILCAHPDIETLGEYQHLSRVLYDKFAIPPHPDTGEPLFTPKSQDINSYGSLGKIYANTLDLEAPNAKKVINKAMDLHIIAGFMATALPNARFIYCARNPLDIAVSCYATLFERDSQPYCYDLKDIAKQIKLREEMFQHWQALFPDKFIQISYEDLVTDQKKLTKKILNFIGMDWHENCLNFYMNKNNVNTASLEQVRKPLYSSSIGRWKNYRNHLRPLAKELGDYCPEEFWETST